MKKQCVLSLSGGMDSTSLLIRLLNEGYQVTCLSFDYGQKHKIELERATDLVNYLNQNSQRLQRVYNGIVSLDGEGYDTIERYPSIIHQIIKLDGLSSLLESSLIEGGNKIPEGHYSQENMKDTVVPNRNKIFSSIIQAVALSTANKTQNKVKIALGVHAGDHIIYPDCRQEFRDADYEAFKIGNWDSEQVEYYTPYMNSDKTGVLKDGIICCDQLELNYKEIYKRTNTSYAPILCEIEDGETMGFIKHKNIICSDYKSGSSIERIEAFINLDLEDPLEYADEEGIKSWDFVKEYVIKICEEFTKN